MTNAEKIKSLTDEELGNLIHNLSVQICNATMACELCPLFNYIDDYGNGECIGTDKDNWIKWLKSEVEE